MGYLHVNVFWADTNYQHDALTETQQVLVLLLLECRIGRRGVSGSYLEMTPQISFIFFCFPTLLTGAHLQEMPAVRLGL